MLGSHGNALSVLHICFSSHHSEYFHFILLWLQCHHFYCDCIPLLSLLCSHAEEIAFIVMIFAAFDLIVSLLIVLVSYMFILTTVLRMNSAEGRYKAFSTCGSHLTVVTVFYGTLIFMYVQPQSSHSTNTDKVSSIFYTLLIPMLNPLIYSLRNKDVKFALHRTWRNICKIVP